MTESRKIQLEAEVNATRAKDGLNEIKREAQSMAQTVAQAGANAGKAIDNIGNGGDNSAKKVDAATKSMIQSIQRTTAVMEAGSKTSAKYYETLAAQRGVDVGALKPYLDQLDAVAAKQKQAEQALNATAPAMNKVGTSAAQTAAALRMIPAQFTDIVVSLQSGQQPLTVLLQQGGQLKDMFGGIGPAARALGGYVVGLINPFTLAAAGAGALAVAYSQGSKEADAYNRALVLTGNAAGVTVGQLTMMAQTVSKSVGTQGQAASALAELAGTGKIAGANLEYFSRVAVQMEKTVGQSVAETARDLAELGESPVEASEKLNQKYRYLTSTIYEQIQALQDQGKADEAAALAQRAYVQAFDDRTKELKSNLGAIESAWAAVAGMAKKGWDAMLDVGRKDTLQEKLAGVSSKIEAYNPFALFGPNIDDLKAQQSGLQELIRLERQGATAAGENNRQNEARISWLKDGDKYLSRAAQMEKEIAEARGLGARAGASAAEIETRVGEIRKKYSDIFNDGINSQIEALKQRSAIEEVLSKRSLEQLQTNKALGLVNERGYIEEVARLELAEFDKKRQNIQAEIALAAGKQNSLKEQAALTGQLAVLEEQKLSRQIKLTGDLAVLEDKRKKQIAGVLADQMIDDAKARADYDSEYGKSLNATVKMVNDYGKAIDENNKLTEFEITLLGKTENARNTALAQYRIQLDLEKEILRIKDQGLTAEDQEQQIQRARAAAARASEGASARVTLDYWKRINEDISRSLTDELVRGGKNGGELIKNYFKTLTFRPVIEAVISPISGAVTSLFLPGNVGQAQAAGNSLGQTSNLFSAGKTLWDGFNSGFTNFGSTVANTVQKGMNLFGQTGGATHFSDAAYEAGVNSASETGLTSFASSAGTVATYVASMVASKAISSFISNGYLINHGNALNNIATLFGPAGGLVSGLINRSFGSKLVGSGVLGSIAGDEFTGSSYQFKKGGFFKSDKTETSDLDQQTNAVFSTAIKGMYDNFSNLGKTIGAGGDLLKDFSYEFRLALADFDDAGKEKEVQRALSAMSDSMATEFVDSFRTSIDTAKQAANRYFTNTIDGERDFGAGEVISKAAVSSPLDPYIGDILRIFDGFKAGVAGVEGSEGKLADFTKSLFTLGSAFADSQGYLKLFGESLDFKKLENAAATGETVVDTFARLNTVFTATNTVAAILGKDTKTAFGDIGLASTAARDRLIELAGGVESLASKATFFAQNFLTPEEQLKPSSDRVAEVFGKYGISGDITKDQFAGIVKSSELTDPKKFLDLLGVQEDALKLFNFSSSQNDTAFNKTLELMKLEGRGVEALAAERARELALLPESSRELQKLIYARQDENALNEKRFALSVEEMRLLGNESGALAAERARELATLDPLLRAQQQRVWALQDEAKNINAALAAVQRSIEAERKSVTKAYDSLMESLTGGIETAKESVTDLTNLSTSLRTTLKGMRLDSEQAGDRTAALAQIQAALAIAKASGPLPEADSLKDALSLISKPNQQLYASLVDFQRNFLKERSAVSELAGLTDNQLSVEEKTLKSLEEQKKAEEASFKAQIEELQTQSELAQQAVDKLNGIDTSIKTVPEAIAALQGAILGAVVQRPAASTPTGSGTTSSYVEGLYASLAGKSSSEIDAPGRAFWESMVNSGAPKDVIEQTFKDSVKAVRGYWGGGDHLGGYRIVGETGPELEATGPARIFNASQTAQILSGGMGNDNVERVLMRVERVLQAISAETRATALSSNRVAKALKRVMPSGNALEIKEATT